MVGIRNRSGREKKRRHKAEKARWLRLAKWYGPPLAGLLIGIWATLRFSLLAPDPPARPENLCDIFREHPVWYDYASASHQRWGTPIATQMAFVYYESSFRSHARPPRTRLWGLIPWARPTTAFGYAQALDPAWQEYMTANDGDWLTVRSDMKYALDFVGWYNRLSHQQLGIPYTAPRELYLAYHEGRTGYARRSFDRKPQLQALASRVRARAFRYHNQLQQCEAEFQCWRWYQFWPFCSAED